MKQCVYLHFGFVEATTQIMEAWGGWSRSISDKMVDQGGHFSNRRELSTSGARTLPLTMKPITGYTVIEAESIDVAEQLARSNPFIACSRIYEVISM